MQVKTGQEMQEFSHFETLKGAFNQNQVLPKASGDGPRWSKGVSSKKSDIQLQKLHQLSCLGSSVKF